MIDEIIEPKVIKPISHYMLIPAAQFLQDSRIFPCLIGSLTVNDRAAKIKNYLEKKRKRKFNKHIRYECRQSLAVKRTRINGRFVKSNSRKSTEDEETMVTCGRLVAQEI